MATTTVVRDGVGGGPRVYKFTAVDGLAGETIDTIDTAGYDYAIIYGGNISATGSPAGSGRIDIQAVSPDASALAGAYQSVVDGTTGDLESYAGAVVQTFPSAVLGSIIEKLPVKLRLVDDGGITTATAFTYDVYLELHRNAR